jgi:hypothetical protein
MYGVSINNLTRWKKNCERKAGAGRKVVNAELEGRLIAWIEREIKMNNGVNLSRRLIQQIAREWSGSISFKASKGWLERFVNRNKHLRLHDKLDMKLKALRSDSDPDSPSRSQLTSPKPFSTCLLPRRSPRLASPSSHLSLAP